MKRVGVLGRDRSAGDRRLVRDAGLAAPPRWSYDHSAVTVVDTPTVVDRTGDTYDAIGAAAEVTEAPLHGVAAFDGDVLTYTPGAGYVGPDQFRYRIVDVDDGDSEVAIVSVTIEAATEPDAVNADPVANSDTTTAPEDTPVSVDVVSQ